MSQYNRKIINNIKTHEGGASCHLSALQQLRRSVLTCMLWEDTYYESGKTISQRIEGLIPKVSQEEAMQVMYDAKSRQDIDEVEEQIERYWDHILYGKSLRDKAKQGKTINKEESDVD